MIIIKNHQGDYLVSRVTERFGSKGNAITFETYGEALTHAQSRWRQSYIDTALVFDTLEPVQAIAWSM